MIMIVPRRRRTHDHDRATDEEDNSSSTISLISSSATLKKPTYIDAICRVFHIHFEAVQFGFRNVPELPRIFYHTNMTFHVYVYAGNIA